MKNLAQLLLRGRRGVEIPGAEDWGRVRSLLGVEMPNDFRDFVGLVGTGSIDGFLWVFNPAAANRFINFEVQAVEGLETLRQLRLAGEVLPYGIFPESQGLLPFGGTDNGDNLYWLTGDDPNDWVVVVNAAREILWRRYDFGFGVFLEGLLSRRFICDVFPSDFPSDSCSFVPEDSGG